MNQEHKPECEWNVMFILLNFWAYVWVQSPFHQVVGNPASDIAEAFCPSLEFDKASRIWIGAKSIPASPLPTLVTTEMPIVPVYVVLMSILHLCHPRGTGIFGRAGDPGACHRTILGMS